MPTYLRSFYYNKLQKVKKEEKKQIDEVNNSRSKSQTPPGNFQSKFKR